MAQVHPDSAACAELPPASPASPGARRARGAPPSWTEGLAPRLRPFVQPGMWYFAAAADLAAIVVAARAAEVICRAAGLDPGTRDAGLFGFDAALALIIIVLSARRGDYNPAPALARAGRTALSLETWSLGFAFALGLALAFGRLQECSALLLAATFALGLLNFAMTRRAVGDLARFLSEARLFAPRRLVVVGSEDRLAEMEGADFGPGIEVVGRIALRDHGAYLAEDLALACAAVRMRRADDVCLALPWSRPEAIEAARAAFLRTPAEIHLDVGSLLARFPFARTSRLGGVQALRVTRPRRTRFERLQKRLFDIALAGAGLLALAPILAAVAVMVRLDSPGPALFRQTRYGFNLEPFRIFKFRSMRTMENGARVVAAKRNDPRVTRLGAFLRRLSIDELPQLLNVLAGEMSIVGPRPHAMAHDQRYFDRLSRYARRHNVKPGITGWAQVHGHRGEIANDHEMLARLEHDLFYVDNWSLWLDIKIVWMTVFSSKAHRNAF